MGFAREMLWAKLGGRMLDTYWQMILRASGGGGGGGDKPWEEMTWDDVIAATKNGKYKNFEIGAMKELDLDSEGTVHMQIVGIDADDLADGSGKAPLTFISKEVLITTRRINPANSNNTEGTGTIGGWEMCEMRTYLKEIVRPLIPDPVRSAIKAVTKRSKIYNTSGTAVNNAETIDDVWIPSYREVKGSGETSGASYTSFFTAKDSRVKSKIGKTSGTPWWLRTANNNNKNVSVDIYGDTVSKEVTNSFAIALGFCL